MNEKHWSNVELLHLTVSNPNISIKGSHSYYSHYWDDGFEKSVVRYLYGDPFSLKTWEPQWQIDKLIIGDYVCIGAEALILMGGNHTHRADWFCLYPFVEYIQDAYIGKGDTCIQDGAWLGMRSIIMPGITIGEGAIIAANAVVTKDVEPYTIVGGNPAKPIKLRFPPEVVNQLLALKIYDWPEAKFNALKRHLCDSNIASLKQAINEYEAC